MNDGPHGDPPECIGTCMVCDPKCPVHEYRAREWARKEYEAQAMYLLFEQGELQMGCGGTPELP